MGERFTRAVKIGFSVFWVVVIVIALGMTVAAYFAAQLNQSSKADFQPVARIEKEVTLTLAKEDRRKLMLPALIETNQPYLVEVDLANYGNLEGQSLVVSITYSNFYCVVDGKLFYRFEVPPDSPVKSGGYSQHIIDLPKDRIDSKIQIYIQPNLPNLREYRILPFYLGTRTNLIMHWFLREDLASLVLIVILLVIFIMAFIFYFSTKADLIDRHKIFYIGLLCLGVVFYYAPQLSTINYLFSQHYLMLYYLEFMTLAVSAIPAILMIRGKLNPRFDKYIDFGVGISLLNLLVQCLITLLGRAEFKEMLFITHLVLIYNFVIGIATLVFSPAKKYPEKRVMFISLLPLIVGLLIGVVTFWINMSSLFGNWLLIYVSFFVLIQVYYGFKSYQKIQDEQIRSRVYKTLMLSDALTGLGNRKAYIEKVEQIKREKTDCWIIAIDMNNLKQINDNYGHQVGDEIIIKMGELLECSFLDRKDKQRQAFRMGGDEFLVIYEADQAQLEQAVANLERAAKEFSNHRSVVLGYALGYEYYQAQIGMSFEEAVHRADQKMYLNKSKIKSKMIKSFFDQQR